ncbi:Lachesin [Eufriesea mexicana]|uniref:Lachesin n=1 Tax=Eufriesea mexicana TaxID=516756 RepID=A0A310SKL1_9HYME|nr:Lachesin [Eufriesea mexicana]
MSNDVVADNTSRVISETETGCSGGSNEPEKRSPGIDISKRPVSIGYRINTKNSWLIAFSVCAALSDRPMFAEPIPNVTVPLGRDVSLPCVIENLDERDHKRPPPGNLVISLGISKYSQIRMKQTPLTGTAYRLPLAIAPHKYINVETLQNAGHYEAKRSPLLTPLKKKKTRLLREQKSRLHGPVLSAVAWIHVDRQMLLTIHNRVVVKVPRFSVSHDNQKTWLLHINNVQQDDRGYYMCQLNTHPMINQVGFLQVVVPPNILDSLSTESTVAVRENQNITLTCKADGYPTPKLMWKREDGQSISISRHNKARRYATAATWLTVSGARSGGGGNQGAVLGGKHRRRGENYARIRPGGLSVIVKLDGLKPVSAIDQRGPRGRTLSPGVWTPKHPNVRMSQVAQTLAHG